MVTEKRPLIDRILYKYEYLEHVEKDGKVYKKYRKIHRPIIKKIIRATPFVVTLLIISVVTFLFIYIMSLPPPQKKIRPRKELDILNKKSLDSRTALVAPRKQLKRPI